MKHNEAQMREKVLYKSRTTKTKEHPEEFMFIIIDGINSCNIPLKMPIPKGNYCIIILKKSTKPLVDFF